MATGDVLGWDVWACDDGLRHANVVVLGVEPEEAMRQLVARVRKKYGADVDLGSWPSWRAELVPKTSGADVVRFRFEAGGFSRAD